MADHYSKRSAVVIGQPAYFTENLLGPFHKDVLEFTWLTERYKCEARSHEKKRRQKAWGLVFGISQKKNDIRSFATQKKSVVYFYFL